jgi:hypothetical protein
VWQGEWMVLKQSGQDADGWQYATVVKEYVLHFPRCATHAVKHHMVLVCRGEPQPASTAVGAPHDRPQAGLHL